MVFKIDSDHVEMMHDLCLYLTIIITGNSSTYGTMIVIMLR